MQTVQKSKYFRVLVPIRFQCRSCTNGTKLFGIDGPQTRQLHLDRRLSSANIASVNTTCFCPVGATELRPPSLTEFNSAFNASVLQLIAEDKLNFVSTFGQAAEVKEIDCSAKLEQRETHLELEATGDPETITDG
jgi:hypothetical protein